MFLKWLCFVIWLFNENIFNGNEILVLMIGLKDFYGCILMNKLKI